jgi:hypothetical protein
MQIIKTFPCPVTVLEATSLTRGIGNLIADSMRG